MDPAHGAPDPTEGDDAPAAGHEPPRPEWEPFGADWPAEDDGPFFAWLPPEDRLWRHPSESMGEPGSTGEPGPSRSSSASSARPSSPSAGPSLTSLVAGRRPAVPRTIVAVALIAGLVGAVAATGVGMASGLWPRTTTVVRSVAPSTSSVSLASVGPEPTDWTAVLDSVSASVVAVTVDGAAGPQVGSGVVFLQAYGGDVYVVTDRSLIARGQDAGYMGSISVSFLSGTTDRARLVGEDSLSGLAVLLVQGAGGAVPAAFGTVTALHVADPVLAVGSHSASAVAVGTVSSEDRTVPLADGTDIDDLLAVTMSPLSAAASGGPLMNEFGQVVGVTLGLDAADAGSQQLTFAVPVDEVDRIATQIIDHGPVTHPWLGVANAGDVPSVLAHQLGLTGGVQAGVVTSGSPASRAGLRADDIITALGGKPVSTTGALIADLATCTPGQPIPLSYVHAGRPVDTTVRLTSEPQDS